VSGLLRDELAFNGLILSDDLEMKAVAAHYAVPAAAVLAVEAGCDGVLICGTDQTVQVAALEALIHAVEEERLRMTRVEDALKRQQQAKERFLGAPAAASRPLTARLLRQRLGRDEHLAIAEEMSRFA
jgi:beta-N-acetylhexosaminidase